MIFSSENNFTKDDAEKLFSSVCAPDNFHEILEQVQALGIQLAQQLLDEGAGEILREAKNSSDKK